MFYTLGYKLSDVKEYFQKHGEDFREITTVIVEPIQRDLLKKATDNMIGEQKIIEISFEYDG